MNLGTIAYNGEIYNLDYMSANEVKKLLEEIEKNTEKNLNNIELQNEK